MRCEEDAYTRLLRQAGKLPLADVCGGVQRREIRIIDERLADDINGEVFCRLDVCSSVLLPIDGHRDERRCLCHLIKPTGIGWCQSERDGG